MISESSRTLYVVYNISIICIIWCHHYCCDKNNLGITSDGEKEEFINEAKSLEELDLFIPMLKLLERQGNQDEKLLNAEISDLIGRRLHDFDVMGAEVGHMCIIPSISDMCCCEDSS